jgi:DNA-binding response OmpR family regulator
MEVLMEYLAKYRAEVRSMTGATTDAPPTYDFAGARVVPHEHRLVRMNQSIHLAPQEVELLRLLSRSVGKVVPYPVLYAELFNQRFTGDTANCRVLLGKVASSFRRLGINLRAFVQVVPKSGYLYLATHRAAYPRSRKPSRQVARR